MKTKNVRSKDWEETGPVIMRSLPIVRYLECTKRTFLLWRRTKLNIETLRLITVYVGSKTWSNHLLAECYRTQRTWRLPVRLQPITKRSVSWRWSFCSRWPRRPVGECAPPPRSAPSPALQRQEANRGCKSAVILVISRCLLLWPHLFTVRRQPNYSHMFLQVFLICVIPSEQLYS